MSGKPPTMKAMRMPRRSESIRDFEEDIVMAKGRYLRVRILQRPRIALGLLRQSRLVPNGIALACTRTSSRTPPMPSAADPLRLLGRHPARELLPSAALDEETIARRRGQAHIGSPSPRALSMREHESAKLGVAGPPGTVALHMDGRLPRGPTPRRGTDSESAPPQSIGGRCTGVGAKGGTGLGKAALRGSPSASPQRARSRTIGGLGRRSKCTLEPGAGIRRGGVPATPSLPSNRGSESTPQAFAERSVLGLSARC
jgi:hypothetical protein